MDFEMDMEYVFMFFVVMLGVAIVMWLLVFFSKQSQERNNSKKPLRTEEVKVLEKSQDALIGTFFVFEAENGERVRLNADKYISLVSGDRGTLKWQGNKIISFELKR